MIDEAEYEQILKKIPGYNEILKTIFDKPKRIIQAKITKLKDEGKYSVYDLDLERYRDMNLLSLLYW